MQYFIANKELIYIFISQEILINKHIMKMKQTKGK